MSGIKAAKSFLGAASNVAARSTTRTISTFTKFANTESQPVLTEYEQKCLQTRAYLREYVQAASNHDVGGAMEALCKAEVSGQHLHVKLPGHTGCAPGGMAPMAVIVPTFARDARLEQRTDMVLPFWVDMPSDTALFESTDLGDEAASVQKAFIDAVE